MKSLKRVRDEYLKELGMEFKTQNSRKRTFVYARNAFICASRGLFTTENIGEVWDRNHSTICYATRQHPVNQKFSKEYIYYYELAKKHLGQLPKPKIKKIQLQSSTSLTLENRMLEARVKHLEYENEHLKSLVEFYQNRYGKKD